MGRIAGRFVRVEPRLRAGQLALSLLSDLPRKNCWTIAEWVGEATPHGMQHLLCRASWDAGAVREYIVEHLHDKLVAATFGMDPEATMIYLAEHVDGGRLPQR